MSAPKDAFGDRPPEGERIALGRPGGDASHLPSDLS